jgi:RNA polymerase sigma factor (sigma-70 family)
VCDEYNKAPVTLEKQSVRQVDNKLTDEPETENSPVTATFLQNLGGLKSYLSRFFHSRHDIDDVLQDAYVRAVQAEKVEKIQTPKAFLYKICKNLAINHHTRAAQRLTDYIEDFDDLEVTYSTVSMDDQLEQENRFVQFCEAVKCLPPQCRRAFVLKKVYGLSSKEVAQRLGITISTVDKHLARGLVICRNHLERKGYSFNSKTSASRKKNAIGKKTPG